MNDVKNKNGTIVVLLSKIASIISIVDCTILFFQNYFNFINSLPILIVLFSILGVCFLANLVFAFFNWSESGLNFFQNILLFISAIYIVLFFLITGLSMSFSQLFVYFAFLIIGFALFVFSLIKLIFSIIGIVQKRKIISNSK
jgi:hypothetical protein